MKNKQSIRTNFVYNIVYEVFRILLPLLTTPYISRILGSEGVGTFALAQTYATYFALFATFGFSTYAMRELAYVRDEQDKFRETFWEITLVRGAFFGVAIIVYIVVFWVFTPERDLSYKIYLVYLFSSMIDISYYFKAIENFKSIVIRNVIIKLVSLIGIFVFVNSSDQIWLYTLIIVSSEFLGQLVMIIKVEPYMFKKTNIRIDNIKKHIKGAFALFIPTIAIQVYTLLDKVMLGSLSGESATGYYDNAQKMVRLAASVASAIVSVSTPRLSYCFAKGDNQVVRNHFNKVFSFVTFISFPMCFGLAGVASNFSSWYYGSNFAGIDKLVMVGSVLIISLGWSGMLGNMILVATGHQKYYTIAVYISAVTNVGLNALLIGKLGAMGALVASIVAEVIGMMIMFRFSNKLFGLIDALTCIPKYLFSSLIMFAVVRIIDAFVLYSMWSTAIEILAGGVIYFTLLLLISDQNLRECLNFLKEFFKKLSKSKE